jgi:hypothetical protein
MSRRESCRVGSTARHTRAVDRWNPLRLRVLVKQSRAGGSKVYYRLYLMRGDRFRDAIEIHAADDESAMEQAEQRKEALPAELWCRGRRVATLLGTSSA